MISPIEISNLKDRVISIAPPPRQNATTRLPGLNAGAVLTIWLVWTILLGALWWDIRVSPSIALIGNYNLSTSDPSFVVMSIALVFVIFSSGRRWSVITVLALGLLVITIVNFCRGLFLNPDDAVLWLRGDAALAPLLMLALRVTYSDALATHINRSVLVVAALLGLLLLARYAAAVDFLMSPDGFKVNEGRPISVHGATVFAIASGILLARYLAAPRRFLSLLGSLAMLGATFATGQGTASVCALATFAITFGLTRGTMSKARLIMFISMLVLAAVILISGPDIVLSSLNPEWAAQRFKNVGTREAMWDSALADYSRRELTDKLIGIPAGPNPEITIQVSGEKVKWVGSLHSMYVGILSRFGIIGLCLYSMLVALALVFVLVRRSAISSSIHTRGLSAGLLVAGIILGYSYELRFEQLMLFFIPLLSLGSAAAPLLRTAGSSRSEPSHEHR